MSKIRTSKNILRLTTMFLIVSLVLAVTAPTLLTVPRTANAQDATGIVNVPIGTGTDFNSIMAHLKDFVLDRLATLMAKQLLHQMTVSVVNWINSGFEGSPAFLTNPEAFFLDAADQVTGAFIAESGPLSSLCSPFSIDIRLSLALNQASLVSQRYSCTLGTIIDNVGGTIDGFVKGDFSQGGWPAFISMTVEPQNNPYGAFLYAQSDLNARISARHNAITADLQMGSGFLSWKECKDVTDIMANGGQDFGEISNTAEGSNVTREVDPETKAVTYKSCQVSTPGSVIAGTLQKNLDVPVVELELANSINAVVDALVSQMLSQMLSGGLRGLSSTSGGRVSYTSRLQAEQTRIYEQQLGQAQLQASASLGESQGSLREYKESYNQAISALNASKAKYQTARACFSDKLTSLDRVLNYMQKGYAQNKISAIDNEIATSIDVRVAGLTMKQISADREIDRISNLQDLNTARIYSVDDVQSQSINYQNVIQSAAEIDLEVKEKLAQSKKDLDEAVVYAGQASARAAQYQMSCDAFPNSLLNNI